MSSFFRELLIKTEKLPDFDSLSSLGLNLSEGEIRSIISYNPAEIKKLWDRVCAKVETTPPDIFFASNALLKQNNLKNQIMVTTHLFTTMTIFENIYILEKYAHSINRTKLIPECDALLRKYRITVSSKTLATNLSPEERKLVFMLRVLIHKPRMLFVGENWNLFSDSMYSGAFSEVIRDIKNNGTAIVFLTTQYEIALQYSDSVSVISGDIIGITENTGTIRKYPRDFLYTLSGWTITAPGPKNEIGDGKFPAKSDFKQVLNYTADLRNTMKNMSDDIAKVTHALASKIILIGDGQIIGESTSKNTKQAIDLYLPEKLIIDFLKKDNMVPFWLTKKESLQITSVGIDAYTVLCVPVKVNKATNAIVLICFEDNNVSLSEEAMAAVSSFAKDISICIEMTMLIGRSALVQESHHRIKNNLQLVISLIAMEKAKLYETNHCEAFPVLDSTIARIKAISMVHNILSHQASDNSVDNNIMDLSTTLSSIVQSYGSSATINCNLASITITYNKAISIALVINELITNSIKHSQMPPDKLIITLVCRQDENEIYISVADNGVGYPKDFQLSENSNIGCEIIDNVVKSLSGRLKLTAGKGAKTEIWLPQKSTFII